VLVPFSTLLAARELRAQINVSSVAHLITVEEFRGHRYLDELASVIESDSVRAGDLTNPQVPALRRIWTTDEVFGARRSPESVAVVDALSASVTSADTMV
ncbi:long-chain fatty acid--CoA ligase, partial [Streptomyces sp. SID10244]|nr:long-chain fatty acid--CoA ligase [Streptomyces sp. SID10244]